MDGPVAKSELEGHIRRIDERFDSIDGRIDERFESINGRIDEQNGFIQALGLKIDLLSSKFSENNTTSPIVQKDDSASSSVRIAELGLDGPIQADHTVAMEQLQAEHIQG